VRKAYWMSFQKLNMFVRSNKRICAGTPRSSEYTPLGHSKACPYGEYIKLFAGAIVRKWDFPSRF
jgi:hypothetical protein